MNKTDLIDLLRHMEWADAAVWKAVLAAGRSSEDQKLRDYLYHLHVVQYAFLRVWRGEPRETPYPTFDDLEGLMQWGQGYYAEADRQLESYSESDMSAPMLIPWASMVEQRLGRPPEPTTLAETAAQVAMHSLYHRGQINARLAGEGATPPLVDYIAWIWMGRPAAEWPR